MRVCKFYYSTVELFKEQNWYPTIFLSSRKSNPEAIEVVIADVGFTFTARTEAQRDALFMMLRVIDDMEEEEYEDD